MVEVTFDELCDMEPELSNLYDNASMIGRCRGKYLCVNRLWFDIFEPKLRRLVGWTRVARLEQTKGKKPFAYSASKIVATPRPSPPIFSEKITIPNMASACDDIRLWSSGAYDVAYDAIYNALNGCRLRR